MRRWIAVVVVVVLFLVAGSAGFIVGRATARSTSVETKSSGTARLVPVPSLMGLRDISAVADRLTASGLCLGQVDHFMNETVQAGTVLEQYPVAGSLVPAGGQIMVAVSNAAPVLAGPQIDFPCSAGVSDLSCCSG